MAEPRDRLGRLPMDPALAGLAQAAVLLVHVAELPHGGRAQLVHQPHLAGRQAHLRVLPFLGHQLGRRAGRAHQLAAAAPLQLDVVDERAHRDVLDRQGSCPSAPRPLDPTPPCRPPSGPGAPGCSASRHPGRSAARCAPSGWGRTRWSTPCRGCPPCRGESQRGGRPAWRRHPDGAYGDLALEVAASPLAVGRQQRLFRCVGGNLFEGGTHQPASPWRGRFVRL